MTNHRHYTGRFVPTAMLLLGAVAAAYPAAAQQDDPVVTETAVIHTTAGDIELELYGKDAPATVKNFVTLARRGFYDSLLVHRVIPGFAIQMGDPFTRDSSSDKWGYGGTSIYGGFFDDELNPNTPSYKRGYVRGAVAMANHERANTNLSQFFIMLADNSTLPRPIPQKYTIFGRVRSGWTAINRIAGGRIADSRTGRPTYPARITSITIHDVTQ